MQYLKLDLGCVATLAGTTLAIIEACTMGAMLQVLPPPTPPVPPSGELGLVTVDRRCRGAWDVRAHWLHCFWPRQ